MAKASDGAAAGEPDVTPEPDASEPDPEASWQRFRDESKSMFKEAFNEWVDEQDGALGDGTGTAGTGGAGPGRAARGGDDTPATTPPPAKKGAAKPSGGLLTDLGLVIFGKSKVRK